jgi:prepilin peptidase CpaA
MLEPPMVPLLIVLLALASVWDATLHRIPNALVVAVAATGALARVMSGGPIALGWSALAVVVVGAVIHPAWTRGWIGGGDLKLAAAAAAWLGIARVPLYLVASGLAIGLVSMVSFALCARAVRAEVRRNLAGAARGVPVLAPILARPGRAQVPAGVGFAVGALAALAIGGVP